MRTCAYLFVGLFVATGLLFAVQNIDTYENSLTGEIHFGQWSDVVNGLQCRMGKTQDTKRSPIILLQVRNVSSEPIAIKDLFNANMLVLIQPHDETYYNREFQWLYDPRRLLRPLEAGRCVEAACRIPIKFFPRSGEYEVSMCISRGIYPPNTYGRPKRGEWWTGKMEAPVLTVVRAYP